MSGKRKSCPIEIHEDTRLTALFWWEKELTGEELALKTFPRVLKKVEPQIFNMARTAHGLSEDKRRTLNAIEEAEAMIGVHFEDIRLTLDVLDEANAIPHLASIDAAMEMLENASNHSAVLIGEMGFTPLLVLKALKHIHEQIETSIQLRAMLKWLNLPMGIGTQFRKDLDSKLWNHSDIMRCVVYWISASQCRYFRSPNIFATLRCHFMTSHGIVSSLIDIFQLRDEE